jgi:uracil-DNA glycosylase family 4
MGTEVRAVRRWLRGIYQDYAADVRFAQVRAEADGVLVKGNGPTRPRLMFVGEAPGAREASLRRPFVGASGKFLDELLASVGIDRSEVFITNVVKYRPRQNRNPTDAECQAGIDYLRREHVALGLPPIVMLGKHARNTLTGALSGHPVGEWIWMDRGNGRGYGLLPLHHPAYGIYQRANRPMMFEQFKAVLTPPEASNAA